MTTQTLAPPTAAADAPSAAAVVDGERIFVIEGLRYEQYAAIAEALPDRASPRIIYFDGRLTFVSPSLSHEEGSGFLCDLVKAVTLGCGIPLKPAGSTTYRRPDSEAGAEGDGAFYLGQNARRMHGSKAVDLSTQPPPDLVIEVEITHPAAEAISAWGRLGVPEVWHYHAPRGELTILHRREDGSYSPQSASLGLPGVSAAEVLEQLRLAEALEYGTWCAQLNTWVRDVIATRLGGGA